VLGEAPLWQESRITGLFSAEADLSQLQVDLKHSLGIESLPFHQVEDVEDRVWEREWLKDFGPMQFGKHLWICPGDSTVDAEGAVVVRLDPGLAFGTGTHATTALCLDWLDSLSLIDSTMLDYGCGSGVLAIAALKLGCSSASAMDVDPQAVTATRANAQHNDVAQHLIVTDAAIDIDGHFDIVIANILAAPLIALAESIASHIKGGCLLALSGILSEQVEEVLGAYQYWIEFDEPVYREQGGQTWARLTGRRIEV
jgi:ribosomal protein L11 methyltransferase